MAGFLGSFTQLQEESGDIGGQINVLRSMLGLSQSQEDGGRFRFSNQAKRKAKRLNRWMGPIQNRLNSLLARQKELAGVDVTPGNQPVDAEAGRLAAQQRAAMQDRKRFGLQSTMNTGSRGLLGQGSTLGKRILLGE